MANRIVCLLLATMILVGCTGGAGSTSPTLTSQLPSTSISPTTSPTSESALSGLQPRPVIIDTDMATDDWLAILYLLQRTDFSVKAITVTGTGEAHCEPGIRNATGLVALAGHTPIPVACGRETPLQGDHVFPSEWRNAVDSMRGLHLPIGQNTSQGDSAVDLLISLILSSPQKITLLALGPLTNLAELFETTPSIIADIEMVYVMGGAVHVPGHLSASGIANQVAEWNIYIDPHAANIVFSSGVPVTLVPLDATNKTPLTTSFYQTLEAHRLTPEATFVFEILQTISGFIENGNYYFWDPLSAVILTEDDLASYEQDDLCVVESEGPQSGWTQIDPGCPTVRVAIDVDKSRFEQVFLDTLNEVTEYTETEMPVSIDPIVGTWSGSVWNGDFEMQATITIEATCQLGQLCGHFDLATISCTGTYTWIGMDGDSFEFQAGDKTTACGEGQDYLQSQPDGSILFISRGDYGETRGILYKFP